MTGRNCTVIFPYFILKCLLLIIFLFPSLSYSATIHDITDNIFTLCQDSPVILLGEQHKQPNSQKLFLAMVQQCSQGDKNVFVGLEIPADKQMNLDFSLLGATHFSFIPSAIDHPAYRDMIHSLGAMKKNVTVKAIDAGEEEGDRDLVMSRNLKTALASGDYDKILVLVGNNHAIKNIKWHEGVNGGKYLAGELIADGVDPCSVQQLFRDAAGSEPVLVNTDTVAGASLAMKVIRYVNHSDEMIGKDVCDAVVEWR